MDILIILALVIFNGIFAMAEIALVSSKKIRLEEKANRGSKGAHTALQLLQKPEEFLSTVQIGITLVGVIAGAYGGAVFVDDITPFLAQFNAIREYSVEIAYVIVVGAITYLSIIIGELVPKSLAYSNPEGIAIALAPVMQILSTITKPIVKFLSFSTKIVVKTFHIKPVKEPPVTEEELKMLIDQGSQFGTFEKNESEIIKSIFRFGDRQAYSIMINRQDIVWININDSKDEIDALLTKSTYSRLPLCEGSIDNIIGILKVKDYLSHVEDGKEINLRDIVTQPLFIPSSMPAIKILDRIRETKIHLAIVIDEYGATEGMITLHDLVENILGELPERYEDFEKPVFEREDGSLLVDGSILLDELEEILKIRFDRQRDYTTLGGFVMSVLNKIPKTGDSFNAMNYKFEVVDMDGHRVDKVLIRKLNVNAL
jgi:putative hemolysin